MAAHDAFSRDEERGRAVAETTPFLRTIVLSVDASSSSRAIEYATALAASHGSRLYVFYAMSRLAGALPPFLNGGSSIDALFDLAERRFREETTKRAPPSSSESPLIECMRFGSKPAEEVVAFAKEHRADLVVIGTHARRGLPRLLLGSVAEKVLRSSPCPVLVVPELVPPRTTGEPLVRRALAAIDYSEGAGVALRLATALALADGGEVEAVHALDVSLAENELERTDEPDGREALLAAAGATLASWVEEILPPTRPPVTSQVGLEDPGRLLSSLLSGGRYDLVACGTHGRSGLPRALFGSVAETLVHEARCPVLVARDERSGQES